MSPPPSSSDTDIYGYTGPTSSSVTSDSTPGELFVCFFPQEAWDLLVVETNRYAATVCGTTPSSRPWKDTTVPEMKAFTGILLCTGVLMEMYWSSKYI